MPAALGIDKQIPIGSRPLDHLRMQRVPFFKPLLIALKAVDEPRERWVAVRIVDPGDAVEDVECREGGEG